jgi:phosphatidate phosphatase APP1
VASNAVNRTLAQGLAVTVAPSGSPQAPWLARIAQHLQSVSASAGEDLHAGLRRLRQLREPTGTHIDTYRGMVAADGTCTLGGRVLARPLDSAPTAQDDWWDNLLNSYRRFDSEAVASARVDVSFRGHTVAAVSDAQGYFETTMPADTTPARRLWESAQVQRSDGGPVFLQDVLCVPPAASFGLISDIDDTVLVGNGSHWQSAVQLTLLRNARTRKPLEGAGELYQAFQQGRDGKGPNPVFYVSASPWNLYDMLVDFMSLNGLPPGPIALRDINLDRASLLNQAGPRGKLAKVHAIMARFPALKWVLVGDSVQIDAELYAETVAKFPGRVLAIYIRDADPAHDSARDKFVDAHIQGIAASRVPMLRVADSNAIAAHARSLGLIAPEKVAIVAKDVQRDQTTPAAAQVVAEGLAKAPAKVIQAVKGDGPSQKAQPARRAASGSATTLTPRGTS